MNFKDFKKDVESAFNAMIADNLFVVNVDKDLLWMSYLLSFEDETIRQDHNCNACKSFIRHYGKVVAIDPQTYKVKTFWDDVHTPGYEKTASDLAKLVKEAGIGDIFIQDVNEFHGCDHNVQLLPDGTTRTWTHLYVTIPNKFKFNKRVHHFDSAAGYRGDVRARAGLPFDVHGEGYDFEELGLIGTEANLRYFEKVTPNYIDCETDVDKFINTCLQFK